MLTHLDSILQATAQSPASPTPHVMDSRGQMRVALRFLPQTSHSRFIKPWVLSFCLFRYDTFVVCLHPQVRGHPGWRPARCKFG